MRAFVSRDGRQIEPFDHTAYFGGSNNSSKSKVLIWLLHVKGNYRTARQLFYETGVSYSYLCQRLGAADGLDCPLNILSLEDEHVMPYAPFCHSGKGRDKGQGVVHQVLFVGLDICIEEDNASGQNEKTQGDGYFCGERTEYALKKVRHAGSSPFRIPK